MNDTYITLSGYVSADPRQYHFDDGSRVTSLRLASTRRVFDKASQSWHDGETTFYAIRCYRALADNVAQSIKLGQPIVVHGKLRIRSYEREGERRFLAEVEATSLGHDLRRGVSSFEKSQRGVSAPAFDEAARQRLAFSTRDWELGGPAGTADGSRSAAQGPAGADLPGTGPADADLTFGGTTRVELISGGPSGGDLAFGRSGDVNLAFGDSAGAEVAQEGQAGDGDSRLGLGEIGTDTVEDPAGVEAWPGGESAERLAA
jgi:single-strand DNA-binding protein